MTQHQLGGLDASSITSRARANAGSVAINGAVFATPQNYTSVSALDTRLQAISGTIYTQAQLDKMTVNDKVYAVRLADDLGTV